MFRRFQLLAILLAAVYSTTPAVAQSRDYPVGSLQLYDQSGGKSSILLNCRPDPGSDESLSCRFQLNAVSYKLPPADVAIHLEQERKKIETDPGGLVQMAKATCDGLSSGESEGARQQQLESAAGTGMEAYVAKYHELQDRTCDVESQEEGLALIAEIEELQATRESRTCIVWSATWEERFRPADSEGRSEWVSHDTPAGACGLLNNSTLRVGDAKDWTLETNRGLAFPAENVGYAACESLNQEAVAYTSDRPDNFADCNEIEFRFYQAQ